MVTRFCAQGTELALVLTIVLGVGACGKTTIARNNRPCGPNGTCVTGFVCNPVKNVCEAQSERCVDADNDGFGTGAACRGPDCNDNAATCIDNCDLDVDNDGIADCADSCIDADRDGYGIPGGAGNGCAGTDCSDILVTCTIDCTGDLDTDAVVDCLDNCIDVDRDGYGVDGGAGHCLGSDCNDGVPTCHVDCTGNADDDDIPDCLDSCVDEDGDGHGHAGYGVSTCLGNDCDDTVATCIADCTTDVDDDGITDCADSCLDADNDGYGLAGGAGNQCEGLDCDDGLPDCTLDCETDVDGDDNPDCADTCLDADRDGYGDPGPAGDTCLGADCDDGFAACTTDCATTCVCTGSDTVSLGAAATVCASPLSGATQVLLLHLEATTTCVNALTALTIERHPLSTTPDGDLQNLSLYVDTDHTGTLTSGDVLLAGSLSMSAGAVSFGGFNQQLLAAEPLRLLVAADISASAGHSLLALQVTAIDAMQLADTNPTRVLATTPLVAGVIAIDANICDGVPVSEQTLDDGPGWIPPIGLSPAGSVLAYEHIASAPWYEQPDGTLRSSGAATGDCRLDTSDEGGTNTGQITDEGTDGGSRYLRVDTGIPLSSKDGLGLPLCALRVRLHASTDRVNRNDCRDPPTYTTFAGFATGTGTGGEIYLYTYAAQSTVETTTQNRVAPIVWSDSPNAPGQAACNTDFVVLDLLPMYQAAISNPLVTTNTFVFRMILDWGDGLIESADRRISQIPEVYFYVTP